MRRSVGLTVVLLVGALGVAPAVAAPTSSQPAATSAERVTLLTDPFLQKPEPRAVSVVWFTELKQSAQHVVVVGEAAPVVSRDEVVAAVKAGKSHLRHGRLSARLVHAGTTPMTRLREDFESQWGSAKVEQGRDMRRAVQRHEARIDRLQPGKRVAYRVVSLTSDGAAMSAAATLSTAPPKGKGAKILLTSDHQAMNNTPAAMEVAEQTAGGPFDAVFYAGDLAKQPDRASEWFDGNRGVSFFPVLQGRTLHASTHGEQYRGGAIIQHAPLFTTIGNHEVQGRYDGVKGIGESFNNPRPRAVAEAMYEKVAAQANPGNDPEVKARWIEDHSFSTRTYEELFSLPASASGRETYYATTLGDVRLISLFATRNWTNGTAEPDPTKRDKNSRFTAASRSPPPQWPTEQARPRGDDRQVPGQGITAVRMAQVGAEQPGVP